MPMPTNQCIDRPLPEKLFLAVEQNNHRDTQLNNVWKVGDIGTLSSNWEVFIKLLASGLRMLCGRESRIILRMREVNGTTEKISSRHNCQTLWELQQVTASV